MRNLSLRECVVKKLHGATDKKPINYYDVYESHFDHLRDEKISLLEIGVRWGGSLWGWRNYFEQATIVGLDIDPNSMQYGNNDPYNGVKLYLGDQTDSELLNKIDNEHGPFDIIIDDGGHTMDQQINTFKMLWPKLKNGGMYVIEDVHTSYWPAFGGGLGKPDTFIEYVKKLIDHLHAYYHKKHRRAKEYLNTEQECYLDKSVYGIHIYDAIIFIQKLENLELNPVPEVNL
jgi:cephalosporin hydroxylase